jgi:hypothetical protein
MKNAYTPNADLGTLIVPVTLCRTRFPALAAALSAEATLWKRHILHNNDFLFPVQPTMNIEQVGLQIERSTGEQISQRAQLVRFLSRLSLWLAMLCLAALIFGNFGKEWMQWMPVFIFGGTLLLCAYYVLRDFADGISRGEWLLANAPARKMWLKKEFWSNDLYTEPDAREAALEVMNLYKIKRSEHAINVAKQAVLKAHWEQRSEVMVQTDYFLDGSSIIRSDDEVIIGAVTKSASIPGFNFFGRTIPPTGPKEHVTKAETHLWALLAFPGTFAFLMRDGLAYSLYAQVCFAVTVLLAVVFLFDLPLKAFFARFQKDILDGKTEKYLEYRLNRLAVMCLRYRRNSEPDVINKILLAGKTGKEACRTASNLLAEYLKIENRDHGLDTVSAKGVLYILSALMLGGMAHSQWRVQQAAYLAPCYAKSSLEMKVDEMDGTLKGSAIAIDGGKDAEGVRVRMSGSALAQGLIEHPHITLISTGCINQSQTEYVLLKRDEAGDWVGVCKKIPLHAVGPVSFWDYFEKQLTIAVKADVIKSGRGDLRLEVSTLDPSLPSTVQFSEDVTTEVLYKPAPTGVTTEIPFLLYPNSTIYVDKYLDPSFTAFSNKTAPGLPQVLAYYNKELKAQQWKTCGLHANRGVTHVSFSATKGNKRLRGDAWSYNEYCKIDFAVDLQ